MTCDATRGTPIVLVGPAAAGKSTIGRLLARELGLRVTPLDMLRWYYMFKAGLDLEHQLTRANFAEVAEYWTPFSLEAAIGAVRDFPDGVIDFGAGHAHFDDPAHRARLEAALAPLKHVVLLLPDPDPDVCERILEERARALGYRQIDEHFLALNRRFVRSESFRAVAKRTVYTGGSSPEETTAELKAWILRPA